MRGEVIEELKAYQRRWNAAALQRYLKRRADAGLESAPRELARAAEELREELFLDSDTPDPVWQAWRDLVVMGLVVLRPTATGETTWRLADAPDAPATPTVARWAAP
ncbi:MAG: hypothetical protein ACE147_19030 [Candidatus Methylomirabilales bacterium]